MLQNKHHKSIGLFLMTYKGLKVLEAIVQANYHPLVSFVCVGTDKNLVDDFSKEVIELCKANNIRFYNRNDTLPISDATYLLTISWRWIIESDNLNLIVFHDSLLPKYRGFAPLVNSLKNGEQAIGVTALLASEKYDEGPIITQKSINISYPIKINDAIDLITSAYEAAVLEIIEKIASDTQLKYRPQNNDNATYSLWLDDEDYFIDWNCDAQYIERFINAVGFPYAGARTSLLGRIVRISHAVALQDVKVENRVTGKIIWFENERPVIVCGTGLIRIDVAVYADDNSSIFPLNKFRIKLK